MQRQLLLAGGGAIAVVVLAVGAGFGLDRWADQRAQTKIAEQLTMLTNEPAAIATSDVDLLKGQLTLDQITINSPTGFSNDYVVTVDSVVVDIPAAQIFRSDPVASTVTLSDINVQFDQRLNRNSLLEVVSQTEATLAQPDQVAQFQANRVLIQNASVTVTLDLGLPAVPKVTKTLPIEDFELTNVNQETLQTELGQIVQGKILAATQEWVTTEAKKWGTIGANVALKLIQEAIKANLASISL
ncbi:MAG: hypothetical protein AAGF24_14025 [Cyanobacteria bacterium P01_H01_bin.121]